MARATAATIELGAPLEEYDDATSIDIDEARALVRGRKGRVALEVIRRWAKKGYRPAGKDGPALMFPAIKVTGTWRTMPSWVRAFEARRQELGQVVSAAVVSAKGRAGRGDHRRAEELLDRAGVK